jgi:hypothetical protein
MSFNDHRQHLPVVIPTFVRDPASLEDEIGYVYDTFMSMDANSAYIRALYGA